MAFAVKRLGKELTKLHASLPPGIELVSAEGFEEWYLDIQVLDANPLYLNQTYRLKFKFSQSYPIEPPEVTFVNTKDRPIPIHPHIYSNGIYLSRPPRFARLDSYTKCGKHMYESAKHVNWKLQERETGRRSTIRGKQQKKTTRH